MSSEPTYSISALLLRLRFRLRRDPGRIRVRGEVFSCKRASSGHLYLCLREQSETLQVAWFRNRQAGGQAPDTGDLVLCTGQLDIYSSTVQLIAESVQPLGDGDLHEAFVRLKAELEKLGYFDKMGKKAVPALPERVAILTSASGAALQDILATASGVLRWVQIDVYHSSVQGIGAAAQMAAILQQIDPRGYDLLLVSRGGGSASDLAAFNTRVLAEAIHRCELPVVSALGHETDLSIADLVADMRLETPSAFGRMLAEAWTEARRKLERAVQRCSRAQAQRLDRQRLQLDRLRSDLHGRRADMQRRALQLDRLADRLERATRALIDRRQRQLTREAQRLARCEPLQRLRLDRMRLQQVHDRIDSALDRRQSWLHQQLRQRHWQLEACSPLLPLTRGYALLRDEQGLLISSVTQTRPGMQIGARLGDGTLHLQVLEPADDRE